MFVEMYVNVVFVIRCLYSTVSLTLVREQRFTIIIICFDLVWTLAVILVKDFSSISKYNASTIDYFLIFSIFFSTLT